MLKSALIGLFGLAAAQAADPALLAEMQRVELARNAAIRDGDAAALERLYAADFRGIAAGGRPVDRAALLDVFRRNAGGRFVAESEVTSARAAGGLVLVEGRLRLLGQDRGQLISESRYLHVFRRAGDHWEMVAGAASAVAEPAP